MYKDPSLNNKYSVTFGIYGFECKPEELTKQLGISPTETRQKEEYKAFGKGKSEIKRLNKENAWLLKSELPGSKPLEEHLEYILSKIRPFKERFKEVSSRYYTEFSCAPYYYEANPGIQFDNKLLKEIADLGTILDLDIYCMAGTISQFEQTNANKTLSNQLSQIEVVSKLSDGNHDESQVLANSLIEIDTARNDLEMHMEDLVVWDDLEDELHKEKFDKVTEDLKRIVKAIKQSKSLKGLLDKVEE